MNERAFFGVNLERPLFAYLASILLVLASVLCRYWALAQTPFANGWDSYYYLVQIKSMEETGRMHSPEASLIYPWFRLFYWFTSDYINGVKWATAVLCGCWTALMFCLPRSRKTGLWLAAWSAFSPQLCYFAAQYPKNLLGMVLFLGLVTVLERAGKYSVIVAAGLLILNYFGHRMCFGLSVLYVLLSMVFHWRNTLLTRLNLLLIACLTVFLLLAAQLFPGLAAFIDFHRLAGTFSTIPQFAPWSFVNTFGDGKIAVFWYFELFAVLGILLYKLVDVFRRKAVDQAMLILCLLLLFPFLEWTYLGLSWRLFLVFVLIVPLLLKDNKLQKAYWPVLLLLFIAAFFSWKSYSPLLHDPDYKIYSKLTENVEKHFDHANKLELLIAHNALAEYFTFSTGIDAMPWLPEYSIDSSALWRIASGVRYETLRYYAGAPDNEQIFHLGAGYLLLPESVWQRACSKAQIAEDIHFMTAASSWFNPHRTRPAWLLRSKGSPLK